MNGEQAHPGLFGQSPNLFRFIEPHAFPHGGTLGFRVELDALFDPVARFVYPARLAYPGAGRSLAPTLAHQAGPQG